MSNEESLREELDKERQKREGLEQQVKGHVTTVNDLQKQIQYLRNILAEKRPETSEQKFEMLESPVTLTTSKGNKIKEREAITDLHFSSLSPASSNGRGLNVTGSSSSFEVIGKHSPPHLQEAQTSVSSPDSKHSQPGPLKSPGHVSARVPVQSSVQHDSRLTLRPAGREGNSPDLDKVNYSQPVQSVVQHDSRLTLRPAGRVGNSSDLDKVNFSQYDVTKDEGKFEKGDLGKANSWPQQPDPFNGTGARPRNNSVPTNNPKSEESERNPKSEAQPCTAGTEPKEGQNSTMFVQIPKDGGTFRINHFPPLNYGQDISMTGISSIFTSDEEEAPATAKSSASKTEVPELNDLNLGTPRSSVKCLSPQMELQKKGEFDEIRALQHESKSPQEEEKLLISFAAPFCDEDLTGMPQLASEDDDISLSCLLTNLIMETKSKFSSAAEDLDRFSNLAEEIAELEIRVKDYQAQIQRLQVHSSTVQTHSAEVQSLRKENEDLKQLLHLQRQPHDMSSSGQELGWVNVTANEADEMEHKQEQNKALEEKLKELTYVNSQLYSVNEQWRESWQNREEQFAGQLQDLDHRLQAATKENQQLKGETATVKEELKTLKHEKHELEQKCKVQESHMLKELKTNSQIKAKWGDMETKVKTLSEKINEMKTESLILKEQLTTTMEDFNKEKKDKTLYEDQLKKLRAEKSEHRRNQDIKLKSANLMIKKREEEIFSKDKTIGNLQRKIDDLNAKLRTTERRTMLQPSSMFHSGQSTDVFCPSASPAYNPSQMKVLQEQSEYAENPGEILVSPYAGLNDGRYQAVASPEHSPDNWVCPNCTYINFSDVKICDMCNSARLSDGSMLPSLATLHSRDEWPGRDVPDSPEPIDVN